MYKRDVAMFDLVSLTVGISLLPFRYGLPHHVQLYGKLLLGKPL